MLLPKRSREHQASFDKTCSAYAAQRHPNTAINAVLRRAPRLPVADHGLPQSEQRLLKAGLAMAINDALVKVPADSKTLARFDEAELSAISRGRLSDISIWTLFETLNKLGVDIEINLRNKTNPTIVVNTQIIP